MTSLLARLHPAEGVHVRVAIFAGPDRDHRAHAGTVTVRQGDEALELARVFAGAGHDVERAEVHTLPRDSGRTPARVR